MKFVKRKGHSQEYDSRKIYASVYAACLTVHTHEGEAELVADKVSKEIDTWLKNKKEISAHELSKKVDEVLTSLNSDAAFMYRTHRDVS